MALVAAAIQVQLIRDFRVAWGIDATITAFPSQKDVPVGYAIIFMVGDTNAQAGLHFRPDKPNEPPFAIVKYTDDHLWSITASHEALEMLVDPQGRRLIAGVSPENHTETVQFLAEVCDPCQALGCAYAIEGHGVYVSDFCLPSYYGLGSVAPPYTHCRSIDAPLTVADGGLLTWSDRRGKWRQWSAVGGAAQFIDADPSQVLGDAELYNLRGAIDRASGHDTGPSIMPVRSKASPAKRPGLTVEMRRLRQRRDRLLEDHLSKLGV